MTFHARSWVYPAVDFMLVQVITTVGQGPFGRILIFIARLQLFLVCVTVGAERLFVANFAGTALLLCIEPVSYRIITGVVHCSPPIRVAITADRETRYLDGM